MFPSRFHLLRILSGLIGCISGGHAACDHYRIAPFGRIPGSISLYRSLYAALLYPRGLREYAAFQGHPHEFLADEGKFLPVCPALLKHAADVTAMLPFVWNRIPLDQSFYPKHLCTFLSESGSRETNTNELKLYLGKINEFRKYRKN